MNDVFTWPVGRGGAHKARERARAPFRPVFAYAVATSVAGAALGLLVGLGTALIRATGGELSQMVLIVAAIVVSVIAVLCEVGGSANLLPQRTQQVPRGWILWPRREATAIGFGLILGAGVLTPIRFASAYVLGAVLILAPTPGLAAIVGGVYGAGRGAALVLTWVIDTVAGRRLSWDALAAEGHLRIAVASAAIACFVSVLVLGVR